MSSGSVLRRIALIGLVALVAACVSGDDRPPLELEIAQTIRQQIAVRRAPKPEYPTLTRAFLDRETEPFMEARIEANADAFAFLSPQLVRQDEGPGHVVVWRSRDGVTLTLRDGILVATRGLRDDLLSASTLAVDGGPQGPEGQGARSYQLRTGDNSMRRLEMVCAVTDLGPVELEIVELTYPTRHLQERCENPQGVVVNDFWVDSRTGRVWQSRQWAGPTNGYLRFRQLTL